MKSKPLDEQYFTWLYGQVGSVKERNPSRTYWHLMRVLHKTEFFWIIRNDDNRAEDGRYLRYEFIEMEGLDPDDIDDDWMDLGCSVFELLIGLSRRLSFEGDGESRHWFWRLIENLGLERYNDNAIFDTEYVKNTLDDVVWRTYKRNGRGGLFPLRRAREDQREVELWYQMSSYLQEAS